MAIENRRTIAESEDKSVKVVEYPNGDFRVSIVGHGRLTVERVAFDDTGGNIMLRTDKRPHSRESNKKP